MKNITFIKFIKSIFFWNIIISVTIITILFVSKNFVITNIRRATNNFEIYSFSVVLVQIFFPIVIGVIISIPKNSYKVDQIDWNKLLVQGLPALTIAIPWGFLLGYFNLQQYSGIQLLLKHHLILGDYHLIAGVWLGKIIAESLWKPNI